MINLEIINYILYNAVLLILRVKYFFFKYHIETSNLRGFTAEGDGFSHEKRMADSATANLSGVLCSTLE